MLHNSASVNSKSVSLHIQQRELAQGDLIHSAER